MIVSAAALTIDNLVFPQVTIIRMKYLLCYYSFKQYIITKISVPLATSEIENNARRKILGCAVFWDGVASPSKNLQTNVLETRTINGKGWQMTIHYGYNRHNFFTVVVTIA